METLSQSDGFHSPKDLSSNVCEEKSDEQVCRDELVESSTSERNYHINNGDKSVVAGCDEDTESESSDKENEEDNRAYQDSEPSAPTHGLASHDSDKKSSDKGERSAKADTDSVRMVQLVKEDAEDQGQSFITVDMLQVRMNSATKDGVARSQDMGSNEGPGAEIDHVGLRVGSCVGEDVESEGEATRHKSQKAAETDDIHVNSVGQRGSSENQDPRSEDMTTDKIGIVEADACGVGVEAPGNDESGDDDDDADEEEEERGDDEDNAVREPANLGREDSDDEDAGIDDDDDIEKLLAAESPPEMQELDVSDAVELSKHEVFLLCCSISGFTEYYSRNHAPITPVTDIMELHAAMCCEEASGDQGSLLLSVCAELASLLLSEDEEKFVASESAWLERWGRVQDSEWQWSQEDAFSADKALMDACRDIVSACIDSSTRARVRGFMLALLVTIMS
jgi:hypothetical protein